MKAEWFNFKNILLVLFIIELVIVNIVLLNFLNLEKNQDILRGAMLLIAAIITGIVAINVNSGTNEDYLVSRDFKDIELIHKEF